MKKLQDNNYFWTEKWPKLSFVTDRDNIHLFAFFVVTSRIIIIKFIQHNNLCSESALTPSPHPGPNTRLWERSLVKARLYAISEAFKASEAVAGHFKDSEKSPCYTSLKFSLIPMCFWCILIQNSCHRIPVNLLKRLLLYLLLSRPHSCPSSRWKC